MSDEEAAFWEKVREIHAGINGKKYTSVDDFKADWEDIKAAIESGAAKNHESGYVKYDSMEALIEHKGADGSKGL